MTLDSKPIDIREHPAFTGVVLGKILHRINKRTVICLAKTGKWGWTVASKHHEELLEKVAENSQRMRKIEKSIGVNTALSRVSCAHLIQQTKMSLQRNTTMSWLTGALPAGSAGYMQKAKEEEELKLLREYYQLLGKQHSLTVSSTGYPH